MDPARRALISSGCHGSRRRANPSALGSGRFAAGGVGMIPRAEVGIIFFAGIGLTPTVDGRRVLDEAAFSAILVMVIVTTLVTPPLLQWSFSRVTEKC